MGFHFELVLADSLYGESGSNFISVLEALKLLYIVWSHQVFAQHPWWDNQPGWKNLLNNLRLIIEPWIDFNRLKRWLEVLEVPALAEGFAQLIGQMQPFYCPVVHDFLRPRMLFSSA